ncbi:Glycosyltransferase involved in cell wall bisynthesis [Amycolatopsis xylanica]|uniref:Glycosyltransferase involved in cell wall bisynthesis n=1 Tax=Amycolatopsis xylanica TaxID=589385 RepID=A0A1H3L9L7_9PSEU|nr:glycosyltransferase [Amycolatopsis xylanica]SDY61081.1 Glycosyltransferase involved in cell wall bisynthesis [Amycolatopsis xylanica]
MRILVYPHAMEIGGSQLNALQLAGAVRDLGHSVDVISEPGPLVDYVHELGLTHHEIPAERRRPSRGVSRRIAEIIADRDIDLVHGYEWPPVLEGLAATGLGRGALVGTVLSMSVVPFFPRTVPLLVGTEQIREAAVAAGHTRVSLLEPPVDTDGDHPGVDGSAFRAEHGFDDDVTLVAMVCRLVPELKLEGLLAACDAAGQLASAGRKLRLAIVGDGRSRDEVAARAARANDAAGYEVVTLTGEVSDPRPAYAAADILIGMGGSALRGMSFGKPLVVVGEQGYSELLTPATASTFLQAGWYGQGPGSRGSGVTALREALDTLVDSPERRAELGGFARELVVDRFSLRGAAKFLERVYAAALAQPTPRPRLAADSARSAAGLFGYKVQRKIQQFRGTARTDDANATPVLAQRSSKES